MTEHAEVPLHAESCTPFVPLQPTVAPPTGVTPSLANTRTQTGFAACTPTGVGGFAPISNTMLSVAAAPYVSAPVIVVDPPLTGSLTLMLCTPSAWLGTATVKNFPVAATEGAGLVPKAPPSPLKNPVPSRVTTPPLTPTRAGQTESA